MLNKKAGEKYLFGWMFLIWVLIAVSIFAGIFLFYSVNIDARPEQARILNLRLMDCINDNFEKVDNNFDFFSECNLNKEVINGEGYFLRISIPGKINMEFGKKDLELQCQLAEEGIEGDFPACDLRKLYYYSDKEYVIEVFSASSYNGGEL